MIQCPHSIPSTVSSPLPLHTQLPPATSNGQGQCGSARHIGQGNSSIPLSQEELAGQMQGHVHFYLHLLPPSSCNAINKLMENKWGGVHAVIPFLKPTTVFVLNPQGYHWIMSRTQCSRLQKVPESLQGRAVVTHNITMSSSSVLLCHHYCIICPESHCCSLCTIPASLDPSML